MADVEQIFFQVKVRKVDQNFLKFLWWPDGDMEKKVGEYCMILIRRSVVPCIC